MVESGFVVVGFGWCALFVDELLQIANTLTKYCDFCRGVFDSVVVVGRSWGKGELPLGASVEDVG